MKTLALVTALALVAAPALAETTWSGTGARGGTVDGSGSCQRQAGALVCNHASTYTNPYGQTFNRTGSRITDSTGTTRTFTTVGPRGHSTSTVRKRNW